MSRSTMGTHGIAKQHDALIRAVAAANPRTVVVLANGAPVEMPWVGEVMPHWRRI